MRSRKKIMAFLLIGACLMLLPLASPVQAESLWSDSAPSNSLFGDQKARAVGDIVTIVINETSTASRTGQSNNSKSTDTSTSAGVGVFKWIGAANAANSDTFKSQGGISNTNTVSGKITAKVTEIMPNGNFVISGTQSINQNGEEQKITVSGVVRPQDIGPDNTVQSNLVADAQIKIDGKGPIANKQREGIISQVFNFLF